MLSPSVRSHLVAWLLGSALLAPAMAQTVLKLPAASLPGADLRQALAVAPGEMLKLERVPLGADLASAELHRTQTGDSAALLVVHSSTEVTTTRPAPRAHFTGQLVNEPNSSVFMAIDNQGALRSIVRRGEEIFVSDMPAPSAANALGAAGKASRPGPALRSRRVEAAADAPAIPFACGVDGHFIEQNRLPVPSALLQNLQQSHTRAALQSAAAPGPQRRADLIIETDYELYQRLGSSSAVHAYVTDLFGYISAQYQSEAGTRLNVTQINVYTTSADPWSGASADTLLDQLTDYWNTPGRSSQARHHVHLISGRSSGGGIAYMGTLGGVYQNYAYGVSTGIVGDFSANNPKVVWDAQVVAHEIGHAFGSDHTHNYDAPYLGSNQGGAIDCCYADFEGSQCATRYGSLPGTNSVIGGSAGTGAGTIMSYCHTLSPGMANISFNFGTNHTRGVNPWRVANVLQSSAQTYLPLDSVVQTFALSVSRQGSGSGAVTSTPAGLDCGSTCSASFISGTQVTLTAQAAAPASSFTGWGGACSGTGSSCTVSLDSARSVTATFTAAPTQRLVTLTKAGTGTGSVTSSPSGLTCTAGCGLASVSFASNTAVTLTAQASAGSTFAGWGGACSGSASCTLTAGSTSASVTASFNSSTTASSSSAYTQQVTTMFAGYFGRPAAPSGQSYYEGLMEKSGGNFRILVDDFYKSAEAQAIYGKSSVQIQVVQVFDQLFGRMPLESGRSYWEKQVVENTISVPEMAYTVAYNASVMDNTILDAKRRASQAFTNALGNSPQYSIAYRSGQTLGRLYLGCVKSASSADAAIAKLPMTMANMAAGIHTYACP